MSEPTIHGSQSVIELPLPIFVFCCLSHTSGSSDDTVVEIQIRVSILLNFRDELPLIGCLGFYKIRLYAARFITLFTTGTLGDIALRSCLHS
ncbi:unnamed protein product [Dicrocoelium dendriticum]|nr:unnamed protein product [Dicrocoelium dendriticum]